MSNILDRPRHQRGYLYRKGDAWYLRYYNPERDAAGELVRKQRARRLVTAAGDYKTKSAAKALAEEFLASINEGRGNALATMTLVQFVETVYLPFVESQKRPSTHDGYLNLWNSYLRPRGGIVLRDLRTAEGERILQTIAQERSLTVTTLRHIKAFLSGAFRYAKRQGILAGENPIRDIVVPRARPAGETFAYSSQQALRILEILDGLPIEERPRRQLVAIVAVAAFTGARRGEIRGFCWEDYDGEQIRVSRSFWRSHMQEPKTAKSKAAVPVIPQLAQRLDAHRATCFAPSSDVEKQEVKHDAQFAEIQESADSRNLPGEGTAPTGLIFRGPNGGPVNLDALARDIIAPAIARHGIAWHGWHGFRRGLATNLHQLGVQDKIIQRILRHSNVQVTQACYIKTGDKEVRAAMDNLAKASV